MSIHKKYQKLTKIDPSRTGLIRTKYMADLNRRFTRLKQLLWSLIAVEDALGLSKITLNSRWRNDPNPQKLEQFKQWLRTQIAMGILQTQGGNSSTPWINTYVRAAFQKGQDRAHSDVTRARKARTQGRGKDSKEKMDFYQGSRGEFLQSAFSAPVAIDKVQLLITRSFEDLKGITEAMSTLLGRTLADGLIQGKNPRVVAREITKQVDSIGRVRALTLARTETVRAHAEGQLSAFERLGISHLGVSVEWSTAEDEDVCPKCRPMEGVVLTLQEASGMLPRHPNCRCAFVPASVGEDTKAQKNTKERIQTALKQSLRGEKRSTWAGANVKITKTRPRSIV